MLIIYNDYKREEWLNHKGGLPRGTIIFLNNMEYDKEVFEHLITLGYLPYLVEKLIDIDKTGYMPVLDAENYHDDINYTYSLGNKYVVDYLMPENLGGDKYYNYNDFIRGCNPRAVIMERTYSCWWPWDLLKFWKRNQYLRDKGIKTVMGIWLESIPKPLRKMQYYFAKLISGNKIFWYSETKNLPE